LYAIVEKVIKSKDWTSEFPGMSQHRDMPGKLSFCRVGREIE